MNDLIFVAVTLAVFGVGWLYVLGCDRIVGRGMTVVEGGRDESDPEGAETEVAA